MPRSAFFLLLALLVPAASARAASFSHAAWDTLLSRHVHGEWVDYEGLREDRETLDRYLEELAAADLAGWSGDARKAFWINAYNAVMVRAVLDHYPVTSVLDIGRVVGVPTLAVFGKPYPVARAERSLDDIEHGILRPQFDDPRIHAAIVCASASCPVLREEAYTAERLDAQLDAALRGFLLDPARNRIREEPPRLSRIFLWFRGDFETPGRSLWDFVRASVPAGVARRLPREAEPRFLSYDWSLNVRPEATP